MIFMKYMKLVAVAAIAAIAFIGSEQMRAEQPSMDGNELERAMGTVLGDALNSSVNQISRLGVDVNREELVKAVMTVLNGGDTGFTPTQANAYVNQYIDSVQSATAARPLSEESQAAFLEKAAAEPGAMVLPSGLVFRIITEGEGAMPTDDDSVRLLYTGSLSNGEIFDETEEPVVFTVRNLVEGFTEGLKMMKPGGIYEITFPAALGYGQRGVPGAIPANAALQFRIHMLDVIPGQK